MARRHNSTSQHRQFLDETLPHLYAVWSAARRLATDPAYAEDLVQGRSGTIKWRFKAGAPIEVSPSVAPDGTVVLGTNDPYEYGIGVWTAPLVDAHHDVYFGTAAGHIFGYSYDGTKLFDFNAGAIVDSYPALTANGTLLIGSDNGNLYALHA